jgi:predicted nucleic acid-binding protein
MLVVDASVVVSALIATDSETEWASSMLLAGPLCAPHLMPVEVANVLRRAVTGGAVSAAAASLAYADLLDLRVELYPFAPLAVRVWEMRDSVRCYDG